MNILICIISFLFLTTYVAVTPPVVAHGGTFIDTNSATYGVSPEFIASHTLIGVSK